MTTADLCYGRRVIWRGLMGIIVDIQWGHNVRARIRIVGGWEHWVAPQELTRCE